MATKVNFLDRAPGFVTKSMAFLLSPFEDLIGTARPLWRDYSKYQGIVNFDIAVANGVLGFTARSTIASGGVDTWFPQNWSEAGRVGKYRNSYHVLHPDQLVLPQADNWYTINPEIDLIPRVIDLEVQNGTAFNQIADRTWELSEIVKSRDGVRPWIYSRRLLVNSWLASWTTAMLNEHYWWMAEYLWDRVTEHPGPATVPNRVDPLRILLHQTADKKPGFPGEAQSAAVDYDRWEQGDEAALHAFIATTYGGSPPPIPPLPPVVIGQLIQMVVISPVNCRTGPSKAYGIVGVLSTNTIINVLDVDVQSAARWWVKHLFNGEEVWSAVCYDGVIYLNEVTEV